MKNEIHVILATDDFLKWLREKGIDVSKCRFCGRDITSKNIAFVNKKGAVCNNIECILKLRDEILKT